jgi:competence CoiA-like predicted nuclease
MLYASLNNEKIEAIPKTKAICTLCEKDVFSKCGEVNVWHWAHLKEENCDKWYEPETQWHKDWKNQFGKELSEIIITKNGEKHIADIQTKENVVIELQNSPILKPIIRKRELFYGEKMLWVINGINFKDNFVTKPDYRHRLYKNTSEGWIHKYTGELPPKDFLESFYWKWCRRSWDEAQRPIFIDFGDENLFWVKVGMGTNSGRGKFVSKKRFFNKYLSK